MVKQEFVETPPFYFGFWCNNTDEYLTDEEAEKMTQVVHTRVVDLLNEAYPSTDDNNNFAFFIDLNLNYIETSYQLRDDRPSSNMFVHFSGSAVFNESDTIDTPNGLEIWDRSFQHLCYIPVEDEERYDFVTLLDELRGYVGGIFHNISNPSIYPLDGWQCEIKPKRKLMKQRKEAAAATANAKKKKPAPARTTGGSSKSNAIVPHQGPDASKKIEPGSLMVLKDMGDIDPELDGQYVRIVSKDPEKKARWLVTLEDADDDGGGTISVSGKKLGRLPS